MARTTTISGKANIWHESGVGRLITDTSGNMFPTKIVRQKCHEQTAAIAWIAMFIWANSSGKGNEAVKTDAADRLRQLEELKLKGIITEKEYEEQKLKILQEL